MGADANVTELSREQKLQLLARLRRKLQSLALSLSAHSTGTAEVLQPMLARVHCLRPSFVLWTSAQIVFKAIADASISGCHAQRV